MTGVSTLVRDETAQARFVSEVVRFAQVHGLGINIWMWRDFMGSTEEQRSFGLLRLDDTEKPVVDLLRQRLAAGPA